MRRVLAPRAGGADVIPHQTHLIYVKDEDTCQLLTVMLRQANYEVESATTFPSHGRGLVPLHPPIGYAAPNLKSDKTAT